MCSRKSMFFVRDAPDEQHHRTIRRDPLLFTETGAITGGEATRRQTSWQHLDRRAHAIRAQGFGHLPRGRDHRLHIVALAKRSPASRARGSAGLGIAGT
jgi:hypothetical protein